MKRLTHFDIGYGCHILNDNNDIWFYPEEVDINVKTSNSEISGNVVDKLAEYENLGSVEDFLKFKNTVELFKEHTRQSMEDNKKILANVKNLKHELEVYKKALKSACEWIDNSSWQITDGTAEDWERAKQTTNDFYLEQARKELNDE